MKLFYKTIFLLFLNVLFLVLNSFSQQAPGIQWQNTIGGINDDKLLCVQQTFDGGYILGGFSNSNISGNKSENSNGGYDYWIVKTDASGNIQWQNTIGGSGNDYLSSLQQTLDGGYILGGWSYSNISGDKTENRIGGAFDCDYWIVKTDSFGNIQWQNTIGGSAYDYLQSIQQTTDGGFILCGWSYSDISGDKTEDSKGAFDYWIVKADAAGILQWQNTIGGNNEDVPFAIRQTSDSGYLVGGRSASGITGDKTEITQGYSDYWILKLDTAGNIQWQNTIGGSMDDYLHSLQQVTDKGFILGGISTSNISGDKTENCIGSVVDYWIVKTDSAGLIQWQNTIGGTYWDWFGSLQQTSDGGYILGGLSRSNISGDKTENNRDITMATADHWIIKINASGNIQWQNTIGGSNDDWLESVQQTSDGGYILGGRSASNISSDKTEDCFGLYDYWIVKLGPDTITSVPNFQSPISNFQLSPNPSSGIFQITFPSSSNQKSNYTLEVINTLGQTVYEAAIKQTDPDMHRDDFYLNVTFLVKGIYLLKINDGINSFSKKLVIQ